MKNLDLSLVVCTRNRADRLSSFFRAIEAIESRRAWELVLVDNGSTDHTHQALEQFARESRHRVRIVQEWRPGLGLARNTGWQCTNAPVVAFTDDDCYPSPDFVDAYGSLFDERPDLALAGGRVALYDDRDLRMTILDKADVESIPLRAFIPAGTLLGANFAVRRACLEQLGGFDPMLGAGTPFPAEDIDFFARVTWAGRPAIYHPGPVVMHDHGRRTEADATALHRAYDAGRGAYYTKFILSPPTRIAYLRAWGRSLRLAPPRQTLREIQAGARYVWMTVRNATS